MTILIAISTVILIGLGAFAVIGIIWAAAKGWFSGKKSTSDVQAKWFNLNVPNNTIGRSGVDFTVHVTAKVAGSSTATNLKNIEVKFSGTAANKTVKTPVNGKVKTDGNGKAKCNFTGIATGNTQVEAKITIDGKEIKLITPTGDGVYKTQGF